MTDYMLWLDLETTGLDLYGTTVLEAAWTITDSTLTQRSPLRRVMCGLRVTQEAAVRLLYGDEFAEGWAVVQTRTGKDRPTIPRQDDGGARWTEPLASVVEEMHEKSGLRREWLETYAQRGVADILFEPFELDARLHADLRSAGFYAGSDSLAIAGAGVGHYDVHVLRNLGLDVASLLHYRPLDVSSAIGVLGLKAPKTNDALFQLLARVAQLPEEGDELRRLWLDDSVRDLEVLDQVGGPVCDIYSLTEHRAASDIAFSLILARCMRYVVSHLVTI